MAHIARYLARTLRDTDAFAALVRACRQGASVDIREVFGGAHPFVVSALWRELGGCVFAWTATADAADRFASDCSFYLEDEGSPVRVLRPRDDEPHALANPAERSARLETLAALAAGAPGIYCISQAAMRQPLWDPDAFRAATLTLRVGDERAWEALLVSLVELGYERVDVVDAVGEFAVRGGIIDIFASTAQAPVRLEFFGDRIESMRAFALHDQRSTGAVDSLAIAPWRDEASESGRCALEYVARRIVVLDDPAAISAIEDALARERDDATVLAADLEVEVDAGERSRSISTEGRAKLGAGDESDPAPRAIPFEVLVALTASHPVVSFATTLGDVRVARAADTHVVIASQPAPAFGRSMGEFAKEVIRRSGAGETVAVVSVAHRRVREVLAEHDISLSPVPAETRASDKHGAVIVVEGTLDAGFELTRHGIVVIGDFELFGHAARRHKLRAAKEGVPLTEADLKVGEFFVHANHGIGQYLGLEKITIDGFDRDFVMLKYLGEDRLYVPTDHMHLIRKYVAGDGATPRLSRMGGSDWARTKSRVRETVEKIAEGLVQLYAEREMAKGHAFAADSPWQAELEESFPYDETPDQRAAIDAVKEDMEKPRPMDRLVCGDVGYGKTEVAIRAAFKAIMDRRQVAVLAPTTVLAAQHFRNFTERFSAFPVKSALLSRFRTREQQKESLRGLLDGSIDIAIGTHRLLQKDVGFSRLGLVVVDEEQRFGVMHKERLKELRRSVDVITLSATPIPRTLHMSMLGVRDLSLIRTAPVNRMAIKTVVTPTSDALIAQALRAELDRGGQVYFVHDRIETIHGVAAAVQRLAPRARIRVGHGQMREGELETVMIDFVEGRFDVLVSTTIIENGLDIPNVNTIIINNADRFGLAQLYQLRGRVGRSAHQAYAYFLYQPHRSLSETASARLEAIREFSHLGSGLQLAMRDLEIRGAGNLLGRQQHGFIAAVGFDGYCQILQEAVAKLRDQPMPDDEPPPVLDIPVSAYIPSDYVQGASQKIAFYQRLAAARTIEEIDMVSDELRDRFGAFPEEVDALLELSRVRVLAAGKGVTKLALEQRRLTLDVGRRFSLSENALDALTSLTRGNFRFTQGAIVAHLPTRGDGGDGRLTTVRAIVAAL
ncbi:MAG TPA: transcription-repair coupling factor [Candidatus Eremiobacteraceae bacterium]|nr:transcription-repair coupling factor [Candidatus Eremiobacteraceae bacterium]